MSPGRPQLVSSTAGDEAQLKTAATTDYRLISNNRSAAAGDKQRRSRNAASSTLRPTCRRSGKHRERREDYRAEANDLKKRKSLSFNLHGLPRQNLGARSEGTEQKKKLEPKQVNQK